MSLTFSGERFIYLIDQFHPKIGFSSTKSRLANIFVQHVNKINNTSDECLFSVTYMHQKKTDPLVISGKKLSFTDFLKICVSSLDCEWDSVSLNKRVALKSFFQAMFHYIKTDEIIAYDHMGLNAWLASEDVGLSSKYMVTYLSPELLTSEYYTPMDTGDLSRCIKALRAIPELIKDISFLRNTNSELWIRFANEMLNQKDINPSAELVNQIINPSN